MSLEQRLGVQITDRVDQQVQHCLRSYENDALEERLVLLVKEWFFKGFFSGRDYQAQQDKNAYRD